MENVNNGAVNGAVNERIYKVLGVSEDGRVKISDGSKA